MPNSIDTGSDVLYVTPTKFAFSLLGEASRSDILQKAVKRYEAIIFSWNETNTPEGPLLTTVMISVDSINDDLKFGDDESYILTISENIGTISSPRIWGALHALETLSQIISWNHTHHYYNILHAPYLIQDSPRFPWRGVMVDTARNFLPVDTLLSTLDALSFNKMNVLHWHTSDAEAVPVESKSFPDLAKKGAYSELGIYSQEDVQRIVTYGLYRGVRVVPEFDMPTHNYAYGLGVPGLILDCPISHPIETSYYHASFDPTSESVYKFLEVFLGEMSTIFPDGVMHVGGDEVDYRCWNETASIIEYMQENNITSFPELYAYFEKRVHAILGTYNLIPMAWDEVYTSAKSVLPKNSIVHVWRGDDTLSKAIKDGFRVVSSSDYYLNNGFDFGGLQVQWQDIYNNDPMPQGLTPDEQKLMLGAEACVWGEEINHNNIEQRTWFRAGVLGERLWSNQMGSEADVWVRVMKQNCRMQQRGIAATPVENMQIFPRRDLRRVCTPFLIPGYKQPDLRKL
uniref:Beta-hexosaminidase n=1 Tax=Arcella intermedia TaxID=1963864 RepID=A0A6B2L1X3_9EUKA